MLGRWRMYGNYVQTTMLWENGCGYALRVALRPGSTVRNDGRSGGRKISSVLASAKIEPLSAIPLLAELTDHRGNEP